MNEAARRTEAADRWDHSLCLDESPYDPRSLAFPPWRTGDETWASGAHFDSWRDDDWLASHLTHHGTSNFIYLPNGQPVPVYVPSFNYVNGIDRDGNAASYRTNWLLEEDDWVTAGIIRSVSQIPTVDGWDTAAGVAAASTGAISPQQAADSRVYNGVRLEPDGTLAAGSTQSLFMADGEIMRHPVSVPTDFFDADATPTISRAVSDPPVRRFEPSYRDYVGEQAPEAQAVQFDDLGYTVPGTPIAPGHPHFVGPIAPSAEDRMRALIAEAQAQEQN